MANVFESGGAGSNGARYNFHATDEGVMRLESDGAGAQAGAAVSIELSPLGFVEMLEAAVKTLRAQLAQ